MGTAEPAFHPPLSTPTYMSPDLLYILLATTQTQIPGLCPRAHFPYLQMTRMWSSSSSAAPRSLDVLARRSSMIAEFRSLAFEPEKLQKLLCCIV